MKITAQILGLIAVVTFLLSYQPKKRKNIILLNLISRCFYILQYVLLGAFSGAVFDILGFISSVFAGEKHRYFIKRHTKMIVTVINICILAVGIALTFLNKSFLDLFALAGVLLEINALWLTREKAIRWVSLFAAPFWFVYNFFSFAYGSAIGNILVIISIITAMIRYKNLKSDV